ncbi:hypothetical protein VNO78_19612 [Psophocarpus tetragonolobus]|uniref:Hypoxanthine phosphoribosyltransferase n=1 Tax=Psophocarpus tetragonolobus TaxID=3891 RepID=A0AAN9S8U6_PSOTE
MRRRDSSIYFGRLFNSVSRLPEYIILLLYVFSFCPRRNFILEQILPTRLKCVCVCIPINPLNSVLTMHSHIDRILWNEDQISRRVSELAAEIATDFRRCSPSPVVVGVATGAFLFLADLVRKLDFSIAVDLVRVESYGSGTQSNGSPTISFDLKLDINGRHVILVEDILDTGHTLSRVIHHLKSKGASSVSVCTFLDKPARRKVLVSPVGEGKFYRGFECPDYFVVGYGMDFAELYRNLPYIGVLKPERYK